MQYNLIIMNLVCEDVTSSREAACYGMAMYAVLTDQSMPSANY